ncbi:MAG: TolC family protein [Bacteroidetes bacterium]|nr:TolC family protein [Bacteroidota bacterium]
MKTTVFLFLTVIPLTVLGQNKLTLEDAIQKALGSYESIGIESVKSQSAQLTAENAFDNRLPTLKATARVSKLSEVDPFSIPIPLLGNRVISPSITEAYALKLTATQPLFTGFKLTGIQESAEQLSLASQSDLKAKRAELTVLVVTTYLNTLAAREILSLLKSTEKALTERQKDSEALLKNGLITESDLLKVKVKLTETQANRIQAEHNVKITALNLSQLTGKQVSESTQLISPEPEPALPSSGERPELQAAGFRVLAAESMTNVSRADWYPSLFLQANWDYANPNSRIFPQEAKFKSTWDVNLVMSIDLWTWGTRWRNSEMSELQLQQAKLAKSQIEKVVSLEEQSVLASLDKAKAMTSVSQLQVEQTSKNLSLTENQYRNGLISATDLLDAQTQELSARVQQIQNRLDLITNQWKLKKARGVLP